MPRHRRKRPNKYGSLWKSYKEGLMQTISAEEDFQFLLNKMYWPTSDTYIPASTTGWASFSTAGSSTIGTSSDPLQWQGWQKVYTETDSP